MKFSDLSELQGGTDMSSQITWNSDVNGVAILRGKLLHIRMAGYGKTFANNTVVATLPSSMVPLSSYGGGWSVPAGNYGNTKSLCVSISPTYRTIAYVNGAAESMSSPWADFFVDLE